MFRKKSIGSRLSKLGSRRRRKKKKKKLDSSLEKVILDGIDRRRISSALAVTKLSKKFISIHELGHFCTLISGVLIVFLF